MSGPAGPAAPEALRDEAVAWLVRVQSDAATADDWLALTAWLEQSPAHQDAFEAVELMSAEVVDRAAEIASALTPPEAEVVGFRPRTRPAPRWVPLAGLAAAAAVALAVSPGLMRAYYGTPATYQTRAGEARDVALADGSRIRLDGGSTMTVRLGWRERRVTLAQAEASFDVAKDPRRPFVVAVGDQQVRVVGTEFNIRRFGGAVAVTVRRGVVEVRQPALGPSPVARLTAGDELRHVEGSARSTRRRVDPDAAFAWTQGRMVCDDTPLAQVVADLNRRYRTPIRLSPQAARKRFSGVLELGDQDVLVRRLASYLSLTAHRTDREITLS